MGAVELTDAQRRTIDGMKSACEAELTRVTMVLTAECFGAVSRFSEETLDAIDAARRESRAALREDIASLKARWAMES